MFNVVAGVLLVGGFLLYGQVKACADRPTAYNPDDTVTLATPCDLWGYDNKHKPLVVRKGEAGEPFKFVQRDGPKSTEVLDGTGRQLWVINKCIP